MTKGWHNQPTRHALSSRGVKTTKNNNIQKTSSDSTTIDWKPYRQIFVNEEGDIGYGHKSDYYQSDFEFFFDRNDTVEKKKIKIPTTDDILQTELHKVDDDDLIQIGESEYLLVNFLKILEDIKGERILYKNTNKILNDWRGKEFEFTIHYSEDERDYPILVEDEKNYYYSIAPFIKED